MPFKEMRTLRIMKATNNIKFQVENVRLDEEENLTFQLVDGEGGVTYKFRQQTDSLPLSTLRYSKSHQFWPKRSMATIAFSKKHSTAFLSLEEDAGNGNPNHAGATKRAIWSIPTLHQESGAKAKQGGVRARTPIKLYTSLDCEPDDRDEGVETILYDPILSSEGDITTIEEVADDKEGAAGPRQVPRLTSRSNWGRGRRTEAVWQQ